MELSHLFGIGAAAVATGLLTLIAMVQRELGPFARLGGGGKWLLTGAFSLGILAFAFKMAVAAVVARAPERVIAPIVAGYPQRIAPQRAAADPLPQPMLASRYGWEALPQSAPAPEDNPTTPEKVALGRRLFFETRLSGDGTLSCSSCHDLLGKAGADGRRGALGIDGQVGPRNTPTVWNTAFQSVLFWDGRARSLEEQAKGPILNPIEMGLASPEEAQRRLAADASYRADFARAFGDGTVTFERIARAIAAFERTLVTSDTPYDRFVRGDRQALDGAQLRGMALFESLGCVLCHKGPNFSDAALIGGGAPWRLFPANATPYTGRFDLAADGGAQAPGMRPGVWRIPSLRNVALTGPWFHNGAVDRLEDAVRVMAAAQLGRSGKLTVWLNQEHVLGRIDRSALTDREVADLVAFLRALSSDALAAAAERNG